MRKTKFSLAATIFLLLCMVIPMLAISSNQVYGDDTVATANPQATYGDLTQYEWYSGSGGGNGPEMDNFGTGPAPDSFDVAWKWIDPAAALRACFSGFVFVGNGSGTYALDPISGAVIYSIPGASGTMIKLDNTYMLIGTKCYKISDGSLVWSNNTWNQVYGVGMAVTYDDVNKLMWCAGNTMWNFSDPSKPPTLVWNNTKYDDGWITYRDYGVIGDGRVYCKLPGIEVRCFDEFTGKLLWRQNTDGTIMYQALYHDGKFIAGSLSGAVQAFDGNTGEMLWEYNPGGYWNFWASWPAAAYGIFYEQNFDGYIYAINATNGQLIWRYKGAGNFYPAGPTVADYKVYVQLGTANYRDPATGARGYDQNVCLDALTGKVYWSVDIEAGQAFAAYGNIYFALSEQNQASSSFHGHTGLNPGEVWCISSQPRDWAMYGSDPSNSFTGNGPRVMTLAWEVKTDGAVTASPTVVDGKVYVGSYDYNIYAFDAYTGAKLWTFPTGYQVKASVAVVNGKVYTGIDDGNMYCINAATGSQIWKTDITTKTTHLSLNMGPQTRSSPKVVDGKVYVGSIDYNFYCVDATTGTKLWTFNAGGEILCSPAIVDGAVYFYANKPGANATFYKLNAVNGAIIWQKDMPYLRTQTSRLSGEAGGDIAAAPCVQNGAIYQAWDAGNRDPDAGGLYKINATTGQIIWNAKTHWTSDTVIGYAPMVYYGGHPHYESTLPPGTLEPGSTNIVSYENRNLDLDNVELVKQAVVLCNDAFYTVLCLNDTDGQPLWSQWVGREIYGLAVSEPGQFYAVCESKAIYNLDHETGKKTSYVEPPAQSWSNPALYDGNLYVGAQDWYVRCYTDSSAGTEYYGTTAASVSVSPAATPSPEVTTPTESTLQPQTQQTESPDSTTSSAFALSTETVYAIAIVVVVIVVAAVALVLRKRKK